MFEKYVKKLDVWDIGLIKLSSMAFILFVIAIWPAAMDLVHNTNPWYILIAVILVGARPLYRAYIK